MLCRDVILHVRFVYNDEQLFQLLGLAKMQKLTMQEACKKLHWHDSWADSINYDAEKQELTIELVPLCDCGNCPDFLFGGEDGTLIFHGVSDFEIDTTISSEHTDIEFSGADGLSHDARMGLQLVGYAYKDVKRRSYDWFTLRFYADSATWHPKTKNE
jgi:hypothetical protein